MTYGSAVTDIEGRYRIEGLPEGNYVVLLPEEMRLNQAPRFRFARMTEGGLANILFAGLDGSATGVRLEGRVWLANGRPAAQAKFTLASTGEDNWQSTTADEEGRVVLSGVAPGEYEIALGLGVGYDSLTFFDPLTVGRDKLQEFEVHAGTAEIEGQAAGTTGGYIFLQRLHESEWRLAGNAQIDRQGRFNITGLHPGTMRAAIFGNSAEEGYAWLDPFHVDGGLTLRLQVQPSPASTLEVHVHGSGGDPVANASIAIVNRQGQPLFFAQHARTDSEGRYSVPMVPQGFWSVRVVASGGSSTKAEQFFTAGEAHDLHFVLD